MIRDNFTINCSNERGVTLLEILASIVILSIIVLTFLTFFINAARTTHTSADVMDATYQAQTEMEELYNHSATTNYGAMIDELMNDPDIVTSVSGTEQTFIKQDGEFRTEIIINQVDDESSNPIPDLYRIIVRIYDQFDKQKAQVETKFLFEEG